MSLNSVKKILNLAIVLALFVVMLGAYTRLTDAGLGCPDWPGCYGKMVLPTSGAAFKEAQSLYPHLPIESVKANTEMYHRYAAGTLACLIFLIGATLLYFRRKDKTLPLLLPLFLMSLVIFQALLGMWTVTLKLLPVVVMGHLLGGILIFASLVRLRFRLSACCTKYSPCWQFWLGLGFIIVLLQIALGGWVSANYAGIACIGFPSCNGVWWPSMDFSHGFNLFSKPGFNYQGGVLPSEIRAAIQTIHRLGAVITVIYIGILSLFIMKKSSLKGLRTAAGIALLLVILQFTLGILNVVYLLPLPVAVAHNGVAALLLGTVFTMLCFVQKRSEP